MVDVKKYSDVDFYGLLGVDISAAEGEIRKAYRKKALECHPDKNPDNPKAAELFHELSKALEILLDTAARAAYDKVLNAKKAAELRNKLLDSKRQKLKADLEQREREATSKLVKGSNKSYNVQQKSPEEQLFDEIERLRKEGSRLLEQEQELMRQQLREERMKRENYFDSSQHRIKIKWKATKDDPTNGGYSEELLRNFLKKYGDIVALVMSKKPGSGLIEFKTQEAGEMAVSYEKGIMTNPLTLEWIGKAPSKHGQNIGGGSVTDRDFETLVLRQMRQAEERKRLIEQMLKEDDGES